jgi:hypothetical protein
MHLKDTNTAPPGGWKFLEERTGHWMTGITPMSLQQKIVQHRENMKFQIVTDPFENLASEVEDQICRRLSDRSRLQKCADVIRTRIYRPGEALAAALYRITGKSARTCTKCGRRVLQMNTWGWLGSLAHMGEIVGWLKEEAESRGHPMDDSTALSLFKAAWDELWTKSGEKPEKPEE